MRMKRGSIAKALQAMGLILGSFALCVLILDLTIRGFGLFEKERAAVATPPEPVSQHEEQPLTSFRLHPFQSWSSAEEATWTDSDDDAFVIGVFGGSVADNAARAANESFPGLIAEVLSVRRTNSSSRISPQAVTNSRSK